MGRLLSLCLLAGISGFAGWYLQPFLHNRTDAINAVVTIFSVLAGFLVAVIAMVGDPEGKPWQDLQMQKTDVRARLTRHRLLFYLYLVTIVLALGIFAVPESQVVARLWLERAFVTCAIFAFALSFALPSALINLQLAKYQKALNARLPRHLRNMVEADDGARKPDA